MSFIPLLASVALAFSPESWRSVLAGPVGPVEIKLLMESGFDIEAVHGSMVRLYVDDARLCALQEMGLTAVPVASPEPLVPYPSIGVLYDTLEAIAARHPDICRLEQIGTSVQGREIMAVVVSDNAGSEEIEPEFRVIAAIHGDEKTSAMVALNYLRNLADYSETSPMCQYVVQNSETWVIPVMNPDGYSSNSRYNANGIDLNRNLSYMWQPGGGGGSNPFSEPETCALRNLTMTAWPAQNSYENPFCASLSMHGGEACFNYVWNYSSAAVQDTLLIVDMAERYADLCQVPGFWVTEGWAWYVITGDVNDWSYGEYGGIDHTVEVHVDKQASDWPGVAAQHYMSILDFFENAVSGIWGTVTDGYGQPLDANLQVTMWDGGDSQPLRFCRTDVTMGDYMKPTLPGTYSVTATVSGYPPQTVSDVAVAAGQRVEVSFVFGVQGSPGSEGGRYGPVSLGISPNPSSGPVTFSCSSPEGCILEVFDLSGRTVYESEIPPGAVELEWDFTGRCGVLPSGIYLAGLSSRGESVSRLLVLER